MVDIETTGLSPDHNAILQITAVCFDPLGKAIDHQWFNRCLWIPPTRFWDESTKEWWLDKPDTLKSIWDRMEDPAVVMKDFYEWAGGRVCHLNFWSKPLSFDFPFIQSYFREFGPGAMPFDFRKGRDLRSFLAGLAWPNEPFNDMNVPFEGPKHDALFDTLHQIRVLFEGLKHEEVRRSGAAL